jgi:hypothetical protein
MSFHAQQGQRKQLILKNNSLENETLSPRSQLHWMMKA